MTNNDSYPKYEYLDHTADAKIKAYGKTLEETFCNAGLATFSLLGDMSRVKPNKSYEITIIAKKITSLFYDFIDELLFNLDVDGIIINNIENLKITNKGDQFQLTATVNGDHFKGYTIGGNVKSMTYNDMEIKLENNLNTITFVVDL